MIIKCIILECDGRNCIKRYKWLIFLCNIVMCVEKCELGNNTKCIDQG